MFLDWKKDGTNCKVIVNKHVHTEYKMIEVIVVF